MHRFIAIKTHKHTTNPLKSGKKSLASSLGIYFSETTHDTDILTLFQYRIFFNNLFFQSLENCFQSHYFLQTNLFDCLFVCLENLAVQPNHEKPGGPNFPTNKKIFLSSFEYSFLNKHVKHLDQQMGAGHYLLGNKDVKIMKNFTIILIGCMTLALKVLAMFTLNMGSLTLKCGLLIYETYIKECFVTILKVL